jgi:hypothetical protein
VSAFGYCPTCLGLLALRLDGALRSHQAQGAPCPGSGLMPLDDERLAAQAPATTAAVPRGYRLHETRVRDPHRCRRCHRPADPTLTEVIPWCSTRCREAGRAALRAKAIARSRGFAVPAGRAS